MSTSEGGTVQVVGTDSGEEEAAEVDAVEAAAAQVELAATAAAAAVGACVCSEAVCCDVGSLCFLFDCENSLTAVVGERRRLAARG